MHYMKLLSSILIFIFLYGPSSQAQSWIQGRCIRSDSIKVKKITAYIIPCSEQDTILAKEISLDTNSWMRQTENFDKEGRIVSSVGLSSSAPKKNSLSTSVYNYEDDKLHTIVESIDGVESQITYCVNYPDGSEQKSYCYLQSQRELVYYTKFDTLGAYLIESQYQIFGNDTILNGQTISDKENLLIQNAYFYNGETHYTLMQKNHAGGFQFIFTSKSNEEPFSFREYRPIEFEEKHIKLNHFENEAKFKKIYLEQFDENGNVIRHIILDHEKHCVLTWYYKIELY